MRYPSKRNLNAPPSVNQDLELCPAQRDIARVNRIPAVAHHRAPVPERAVHIHRALGELVDGGGAWAAGDVEGERIGAAGGGCGRCEEGKRGSEVRGAL